MSQKTTLHRREVWDQFWQEREEIEQVYSNSERVIDQLIRLGDPAGKWILEVGAGSGRDSLALSSRGGRVIMLDYSAPALEVIQKLAQKTGRPVYLVRGDAFHLPFRSDALDLVFHQGLLEHFTAPEGILAENLRVLRPGGAALADVPQRYHLYTAVKHLLIAFNRWFAGWETEFSRARLERIFAQTGFVRTEFYGEWMRPSFIYRASREALKKAGITLPLYPPSLPLFGRIRAGLRALLRRHPWHLNTVMDIGAIGFKPVGSDQRAG
ncbi:MAG: Demethylmenaquinone methyltransferase [bacterium ADurb.Bin431]|nr:MAG: Demethylmenaquinone methyltransferase [bacterium ADurb.Bin431]HOC25663.1 class I SAM-dependent methyltransferase [bacterium]HPG83538.1 class I SAM-dependent methyltransferase [bacterium]